MPWNDGAWNSGTWDDMTVGSFNDDGTRKHRTASTEALYRAVPTYVRRADINGQLFGFVSTWGDHFHDLVDVILGINGDPSTLADPVTVSPAWWPWLARMCNYKATTEPGAGLGVTPFARQRTRIADSRRLRHCTPWTIRETVRDLWPAATDANMTISTHWRDNRWLVRVKTVVGEVPDTGTFVTSWGDYEDTYGCWGDHDAMSPTWSADDTIDRIHCLVSRTLKAETPAGVQMVHNRL